MGRSAQNLPDASLPLIARAKKATVYGSFANEECTRFRQNNGAGGRVALLSFAKPVSSYGPERDNARTKC